MGWERRGSGCYYYRKRRQGSRVVSEYVGAGEHGAAAATRDILARAERERLRQERIRERERLLALEQAGSEAEEQVRMVTRAWLLAAGYHTHKGQWRRRRRT